MKKIIIVGICLTLVLSITGCNNSTTKVETKKWTEEEVRDILEKSREESEDKVKDIEVDTMSIKYYTHTSELVINAMVKNNTNNNIYVSSSNFTLSDPSNHTVSPVSSSVNTFRAIDLQPRQSTNGEITFKDISMSGLHTLNFNHNIFNEKISIRIN